MSARIVCPDCEMSSPDENDIRTGYCGRCHWWTSDPILGPAWRAANPKAVAEAHAFRDLRRTQQQVIR